MEKTKKPEFETSQTLQNLARAFSGECQDNIRLKMISKKALDEQNYFLSKHLYGIAKHDCIHATLFYHAIIDTSKKSAQNIEITAGYPFKRGKLSQNVQNAVDNLRAVGNAIYPTYATVAKDEGFLPVATMFFQIAQVKLLDAQKLENLHTQLFGKMKLQKNEICSCSVCGFSLPKQEKICPLCGSNFSPHQDLNG